MADAQGGLAAVTDIEEEEVITPDSIDVGELVSRTTDPKPGQSITSMILQHKQESMDLLRDGRSRIAERRAAQAKADNRNKWLSLAQGMLAPTRTGSFGESLGASAGLLRQESELRSKHAQGFGEEESGYDAAEMDAKGQSIDQLIAMDKAGRNRFGQTTVGGPETAVHPDDVNNGPENQRLVLAQAYQDPNADNMDESIQTVFLKDENGEYILAADRTDPTRMGAITRAQERAQQEETRSQTTIGDALIAHGSMYDINRAMSILEQVDPTTISTSGINKLKNTVANILGVSFGDTEDLTELQMIIADNYLKRLADLKGSSSNTELREMKSISANIGQNATANYRALVRMKNLYGRIIRRGLREADQRGNVDNMRDMWPAYDPDVEVLSPGSKGKREYDKLEAGAAYYDDYGSPVMYKGDNEE